MVSKKEKSLIWLLVCVFCFALVTQPALAIDRAREAGFVPHKALYDIRLSSKKSSAKISNISGKMFYEWQPACDAWVSNHRFDMLYEYVEMPAVRVTSEFSTYESFDGQAFNYTSQRKREGLSTEEVRGSVQANGTPYPNEAIYTIPKDVVFDLPEGTLFPMAHTLDVLEKIKAGKKFYNATIFDGSDEEGPVDVNSFIGKTSNYSVPEAYQEYIKQDLVTGQSWNIRLAFFPLVNDDSTSDYEMSLVFHDNGVISDMTIEYSDFSVTQNLVALEEMPDACETNGHNKKSGK